MQRCLLCFAIVLTLSAASLAGDGNRLTYLDEFSNPYWVGLKTAKLVTPQWVGEPGVEAVIVMSTDDLRDPDAFEKHLRPTFDRLKQIDGRAPFSLMTNHVDRDHPLLAQWLREGISLETHTFDHPCPCLHNLPEPEPKGTFDQSVDIMCDIPNSRPVGFRMPCCDSMNSFSPRFVAEIFNKVTPLGNYLYLDSSVLTVFTADDGSLARGLVTTAQGEPRLLRYAPRERSFVNYVENYPYPYVIARLCWEIPGGLPDDWMGFNRNNMSSPSTLEDMLAAVDCTVAKQGQYTLICHTNNWIGPQKKVDLVDYAHKKYGRKVKFLNFREVHQRLVQNVCGGQALRAANGQDNGVRVLDLNGDGYMDAVVGNERLRQTRVWQPQTGTWTTGDFPVALVTLDAQGNRLDAGVRFGILRADGKVSMLVRGPAGQNVWHFDGQQWIADPQGLAGLDIDGQPVATAAAGRDCGVRLRDLDGDGICELLVGNERQNAAFRWLGQGRGWKRLPFGLPSHTAIVDAQGRDAGLRLVDIDEDGRADVVFSNAQRYSFHRWTSIDKGWSHEVFSALRGGPKDLPMIVRADGTNNGVWFSQRHMWLQNEQTGVRLRKGIDPLKHSQIDSRSFAEDFLGRPAAPASAAR
jgi:peptidoglycan/xylan/chitin deacetylase (PgdA/CDA1 family)